MLYFNEDSGNVIFICNKMGILNIDLNNFNLDGTNYEKDDPDTIILIRLLAWHIKFEKRKTLKKELNEELILISWHPLDGGIGAFQKMRKNKNIKCLLKSCKSV